MRRRASGQGRAVPGSRRKREGQRAPPARGRERGSPRAQVRAVQCIRPGIRRMPAHHARHHHPQPRYNIDPSLGALVPPQLTHRHDPASAVWEPWAELALMAAAPVVQEPRAEPARMAGAPAPREPQAEPARGCEQAPQRAGLGEVWVRDWDAIPDPPGREGLAAVLQALGWLNWATSEYRRTRSFEDVLLRCDGGKQEMPARGWMAQEDHERVL